MDYSKLTGEKVQVDNSSSTLEYILYAAFFFIVGFSAYILLSKGD